MPPRLAPLDFVRKHIQTQTRNDIADVEDSTKEVQRRAANVLAEIDRAHVDGKLDHDYDLLWRELEGAETHLAMARFRLASLRGLRIAMNGARRAG